MTKGKPKQPALGIHPKGGKQLRLGADPDQAAMIDRLSWRFSMLDAEHADFGWKQCTLTKIEEIRGKLCHHEKLTIKEFHSLKGTNKIAISKLSKDARERLEDLDLDDVDDLFEIRFSGKERVWGTMTGAVFNLLWWDPNHLVYKVTKKHT